MKFDEVFNNFSELGDETEIVSSNMDFAVILIYSDNLLVAQFVLLSMTLRVEKKSISQRNAIKWLILENKSYRPISIRLFLIEQTISCLVLF